MSGHNSPDVEFTRGGLHARAPLPTATTVLDSILFRDAFGTAADARGVLRPRADRRATSRSRSRWRKAEARCGVIPAEAAERDRRALRTSTALDFDLLRQETDIVGYPILPLVHQLAKQCGEAGRYVHWGATTQDIMDTAVVLQMRAALQLIEDDIAALRGILADLAQKLPRHADGRPHASAAGAAGDLRLQGRDLARHVRPPRRAAGSSSSRASWSAQFAGAAGTLASLGDKGLDVQDALMRGARPRRAGLHLARRARRLRRSR